LKTGRVEDTKRCASVIDITQILGRMNIAFFRGLNLK
jgi:hypothetical protein